MRSLFPVLLISIAAGCTAKPPSPPPSATPPLAGPPPGIVLIAAHEAAGPDETVLLSLSNTLDHFIRIEPICDIEVQVQVDGEWTDLWRPDCTRVRVRPQPLAAGQTWTGEMPVAPWREAAAAAGGRVRVAVKAWGEGIPLGYVVSDAFLIPSRR